MPGGEDLTIERKDSRSDPQQHVDDEDVAAICYADVSIVR
jgi:hypothetical protein